MLEIKFRAWDKNPEFTRKARMINWRDGEIKNNFGSWIDAQKKKEVVLMQYTGLKDWHKKEIYIGDIVRFTFKAGVGNEITEVIEDMYSIYDHCWEKDVDYVDIKVVVNIYENAELLK